VDPVLGLGFLLIDVPATGGDGISFVMPYDLSAIMPSRALIVPGPIREWLRLDLQVTNFLDGYQVQ
jgi:hypothetical protein